MVKFNTTESQKVTLIQDALCSWFFTNGRNFPWRDDKSSIFEKIVTEILLQRTKAETVSKIFSSFFSRFDSWEKLNNATIEEIEEQIKPLGIWRRRSLTLKKLSYEMVKAKSIFSETRDEIDKLSGVGQYVGNAVEMFYHKRPMPLLDTNMARVIERVFKPRKLADIRYDPWLQNISRKIVDCENTVHVNWALLDLGGTICKPRNPKCCECPLSGFCNFRID